MARKKPRREIEIERNVIEKSLMDIKDFVRDNRKTFLYSSVAFLALVVILIGAFVYVDTVNSRNRAAFDIIVEKYDLYSERGDLEQIGPLVKDLKEFVDSTSFGFSHRMARYMLGSLYFDSGEYGEALACLTKFSRRAPSPFFASLSLVKAAVCAEELGDYDKALELYAVIEEDFSDSMVVDQALYNKARIYSLKGDYANSGKYYNRVVTSFPQSPYASRSRKKIMLMGSQAR